MSVTHALSSRDFQKALAFGQMGETDIAKWLIAKGRAVLPVYDIEFEAGGKGPRVFSAKVELAAPDLLVFRGKGSFVWCEAKHKTVFTWYRKENRWETGMDLHHWHQYQQVQETTGIPVYVFFLHRNSTPDKRDLDSGSDEECPTGLFGQTLSELANSISHTSNKHGNHGMVYWAHESLQWHDSVENVLQIANRGVGDANRPPRHRPLGG